MERQPRKIIRTPFTRVVIVASVLLMVLPFISSINSFLTNLLLRWQAYRVLENLVVPYEARLLGGFLNFLGFSTSAVSKGVWVEGAFLEIQWNCLGWQSLVLLVASFLGGFQARFSFSSRLEVVLIGFLGTFLINFARLTTVAILAVRTSTKAAVFFHDYLALVFIIFWFCFFWWFAYSFVLEEADGSKRHLS